MEGPLISTRPTPDHYPWWVHLFMHRSPTRRAMNQGVGTSFGLGILCIALFLYWQTNNPILHAAFALCGIAGFVFGAWYWAVVRWVDAHGQWRPGH